MNIKSTNAVFCRMSAFICFCLVSWNELFACAVCDGNTPEPVRNAYNLSTAWLSLVPLLFMGSVMVYIYRLVKRGQAEE